AGTVMVKDIFPGEPDSFPTNLKAVGGTLFFLATDEISGDELWKSDGTAAGTAMVRDINTGSSDWSPNYLTLANVGGGLQVFFRANDPTHGTELWKSDGPAAGTVLVRDINLNTADSILSLLQIEDVGGIGYFEADDGVSGTELWRSVGTAAGTV